jgi:hypothetical protein
MQIASRASEGKGMQQLLTDSRQTCDQAHEDDPEFSSGPMPAAFSACLFLSLGVLFFLGFALLMP